MLVHADLFKTGESIDTDTVERVAEQAGAAALGPFAVVESEGWKTIALEEESLAETGWEETASAEETAALVTRREDSLAGLRPEETRGIFSPEDIARLKIDALTSGEQAARVSALRKLRLAPLSSHEKGNIFLRVLLDPISPARGEAIKGLEDIGFDLDTAEAIQDVLEKSGPARAAAIERVGALLGSLGAGEQQIALRVLVEGFREFEDPRAQADVLRVLGHAAPLIAGLPDVLEEMVRLSLRKVVELPAQSADRVRGFLFRLATHNPTGMDELLFHGMETMRDPNMRAFALTLLAQLDLSPEKRRRTAEAMVECALDEGLDELNRQKVGHNLVSFGRLALDLLIRAYPSAPPPGRRFMTKLLDMLVMDREDTKDMRNRVAELFLESLRVSDRPLRMAIYHTRVFGSEGVNPEVRSEATETLVAQIRKTDHPDILDRVGDMIESMGRDAVAPMLDALRDEPRGRAGDLIARIMGRTLAHTLSCGEEPPPLKGLLSLLRKQVQDKEVISGGYAVALGALAAGGAEPEEAAQRDADLLLAALGKRGYHEDLIEALGLLATSAAIDLQRRLKIIGILLDIVHRAGSESDESGMRELDTPEGVLYDFSGQVAFDTEALPAAIEALERVYRADATTDAVRSRILSEMAAVWEKVASWDLVWGPKSSEKLALALGGVCAREDTPTGTCLGIARSMRRQVNRISVVRAMRLLYESDLEDEDFNRVAAETGLEVLDQWDQPETSPEEREDVLLTVARIAARPQLNNRAQAARRLRRRTVEMLFDALGEGAPWAWTALRTLCDCPTAPKNFRQDLAERLREASTLVRTE